MKSDPIPGRYRRNSPPDKSYQKNGTSPKEGLTVLLTPDGSDVSRVLIQARAESPVRQQGPRLESNRPEPRHLPGQAEKKEPTQPRRNLAELTAAFQAAAAAARTARTPPPQPKTDDAHSQGERGTAGGGRNNRSLLDLRGGGNARDDLAGAHGNNGSPAGMAADEDDTPLPPPLDAEGLEVPPPPPQASELEAADPHLAELAMLQGTKVLQFTESLAGLATALKQTKVTLLHPTPWSRTQKKDAEVRKAQRLESQNLKVFNGLNALAKPAKGIDQRSALDVHRDPATGQVKLTYPRLLVVRIRDLAEDIKTYQNYLVAPEFPEATKDSPGRSPRVNQEDMQRQIEERAQMAESARQTIVALACGTFANELKALLASDEFDATQLEGDDRTTLQTAMDKLGIDPGDDDRLRIEAKLKSAEVAFRTAVKSSPQWIEASARREEPPPNNEDPASDVPERKRLLPEFENVSDEQAPFDNALAELGPALEALNVPGGRERVDSAIERHKRLNAQLGEILTGREAAVGAIHQISQDPRTPIEANALTRGVIGDMQDTELTRLFSVLHGDFMGAVEKAAGERGLQGFSQTLAMLKNATRDQLRGRRLPEPARDTSSSSNGPAADAQAALSHIGLNAPSDQFASRLPPADNARTLEAGLAPESQASVVRGALHELAEKALRHHTRDLNDAIHAIASAKGPDLLGALKSLANAATAEVDKERAAQTVMDEMSPENFTLFAAAMDDPVMRNLEAALPAMPPPADSARGEQMRGATAQLKLLRQALNASLLKREDSAQPPVADLASPADVRPDVATAVRLAFHPRPIRAAPVAKTEHPATTQRPGLFARLARFVSAFPDRAERAMAVRVNRQIATHLNVLSHPFTTTHAAVVALDALHNLMDRSSKRNQATALEMLQRHVARMSPASLLALQVNLLSAGALDPGQLATLREKQITRARQDPRTFATPLDERVTKAIAGAILAELEKEPIERMDSKPLLAAAKNALMKDPLRKPAPANASAEDKAAHGEKITTANEFRRHTTITTLAAWLAYDKIDGAKIKQVFEGLPTERLDLALAAVAGASEPGVQRVMQLARQVLDARWSVEFGASLRAIQQPQLDPNGDIRDPEQFLRNVIAAVGLLKTMHASHPHVGRAPGVLNKAIADALAADRFPYDKVQDEELLRSLESALKPEVRLLGQPSLGFVNKGITDAIRWRREEIHGLEMLRGSEALARSPWMPGDKDPIKAKLGTAASSPVLTKKTQAMLTPLAAREAPRSLEDMLMAANALIWPQGNGGLRDKPRELAVVGQTLAKLGAGDLGKLLKTLRMDEVREIASQFPEGKKSELVVDGRLMGDIQTVGRIARVIASGTDLVEVLNAASRAGSARPVPGQTAAYAQMVITATPHLAVFEDALRRIESAPGIADEFKPAADAFRHEVTAAFAGEFAFSELTDSQLEQLPAALAALGIENVQREFDAEKASRIETQSIESAQAALTALAAAKDPNPVVALAELVTAARLAERVHALRNPGAARGRTAAREQLLRFAVKEWVLARPDAAKGVKADPRTALSMIHAMEFAVAKAGQEQRGAVATEMLDRAKDLRVMLLAADIPVPESDWAIPDMSPPLRFALFNSFGVDVSQSGIVRQKRGSASEPLQAAMKQNFAGIRKALSNKRPPRELSPQMVKELQRAGVEWPQGKLVDETLPDGERLPKGVENLKAWTPDNPGLVQTIQTLVALTNGQAMEPLEREVGWVTLADGTRGKLAGTPSTRYEVEPDGNGGLLVKCSFSIRDAKRLISAVGPDGEALPDDIELDGGSSTSQFTVSISAAGELGNPGRVTTIYNAGAWDFVLPDTLASLLSADRDSPERSALRATVDRCYQPEGLDFHEALETFDRYPTFDQLTTLANKFIKEGAQDQANISAKLRNPIMNAISQEGKDFFKALQDFEDKPTQEQADSLVAFIGEKDKVAADLLERHFAAGLQERIRAAVTSPQARSNLTRDALSQVFLPAKSENMLLMEHNDWVRFKKEWLTENSAIEPARQTPTARKSSPGS